MTPVRILSSRDANESQIAVMVALADAHRKALGFMPASVIRGLAKEDKALLATDSEGVVCGYALYELPHAEVRLVHLCVASDARGAGIGRQLVDTLSVRHANRRGIRLKCRSDYAANEAWPNLGFSALNEVPGRGKGTTLVIWWRDHGHPDLFTHAQPDLLVALDTDVFSDLFGPDSRGAGAEESMILHPEHGVLDESVALVRTTQLSRELRQVGDDRQRQQMLHSLASLRALPSTSATGTETLTIRQTLLAAIPRAELQRDPSLEQDALMVAAAYTEGADCLATRDVGCRELIGPVAAKTFAFPVLHPTDVVVLADQLRAAAVYTPAALAETSFTVVTVGAEDSQLLRDFLSNRGGERLPDWRSRLALAVSAALRGGGDRELVRDVRAESVGLMLTNRAGDTLHIPVLRIRQHRLALSVGRQLVARLRESARKFQCTKIVVSDPHIDPRLADALMSEGFRHDAASDGVWWASVLDTILTRNEVQQLPHDLVPTNPDAADFEHTHWPVKVRDAGIPCYVVPIKPQFAGELLGGGRHLLGRKDELGLAREQVYYHAPGPNLRWPSRILWYESGHVGAVTACSSLTDVLRREPDDLYRRNARLGVYTRERVRGAARNSIVEALLFRDTEQLNPVNFSTLKDLEPSAFAANLRTVTSIGEDLFMSIYTTGRGR